MTAHKQKFVVALTGGIGSGKSAVARLFSSHGIAIIDTDAIAHNLTAPEGLAIPAIRSAFGEAFIEDDGRMNRAKMRDLVFSTPSAKSQLESILHPLIRQQGAKAMEEAKSAYVMVDVPLLAETAKEQGSWAQKADRILVVDCPVSLQRQRVIERSLQQVQLSGKGTPMTAEQVDAIIAKQASREQRLSLATNVIDNSTDLESLKTEVDSLHTIYLRLSEPQL